MLLLAAFPVRAEFSEQAGTYENGLYLEELSLAGMTPEEANLQVQQRIEAASSHTFTVHFAYDESEAGVASIALSDLGLACQNPDLLAGLEKKGHQGTLLDQFKSRKALEQNPEVYDLVYNWDMQKVYAWLSQQAVPYHVDPIEATVWKDGGEFWVSESRTGWDVNVDSTIAQMMRAFADWDEVSDLSVTAVMEKVEPNASQEALMTIGDKLGEATTYYSGDDSLGRNINLALGTSLINGSVVLPGEVFSANAAMEPYEEEYGWQLGGSYTADGQVEETLGGGVCQISSTFYNAALYAELEIVQRNAHSMSVGYLPLSLDAAIAGDWKDVKIRNNYDTPIYIECYAANNTLYFAIWGHEVRDPGRSLSFESITLETWTEEKVTYVEDPEVAPGTQVQAGNGHTGYHSVVYKHVYQDGQEIEVYKLNEDTYRASGPLVKVAPGEIPADANP